MFISSMSGGPYLLPGLSDHIGQLQGTNSVMHAIKMAHCKHSQIEAGPPVSTVIPTNDEVGRHVGFILFLKPGQDDNATVSCIFITGL